MSMTKIDLDEIEASLGYLEDWKNVLNELRLARKVVEAAKHMRRYCLGNDASTENMLGAFDQSLKNLDEARRG
jgi:hypothetical protein